MSLSRRQIASYVILSAAAILVLLLALRNPQPPLMPRDDEHNSFVSSAACLACHGPDGALPQRRSHPLGPDCLRCHGYR